MWWNFLAAFFVGSALGESRSVQRFVRAMLLMILIGGIACGIIYACIVFNAVSKQALHERSKPSHVHHSR